jgi:FkbH-like protein
MYESEANSHVEPIQQVPAEVVASFLDLRQKLTARTLLPWGEHCTECVWPTCYTSCDLYSPRPDGRCRRFVEGIVRIDCPGSVNSYLLKVKFKRWGKLWAPGNIHLLSLSEADRAESLDQKIAKALYQLPLPHPVRNFASGKRYGWKKRLATNRRRVSAFPNQFVIECYNPGPRPISLSLTMRTSNSENKTPYQSLFQVYPGFQREIVPVPEICKYLDLSAPFSVDLIPNDIEDGATLFFGLIDFVDRQPRSAPKPEIQARVKCVVWDLDNTLWDGVLVEDGADKLVLKAGIVDIIKELDRRGILHSIASKNNFDEAMAVLKNLGLEDYFLHPQISWNPKSEALKTIAAKLNIGIDTLMLVDDSEFELAQAQAGCSETQLLRADLYLELPRLAGCQGQVTEESVNRRKMYQQEAVRESSAQSFSGDYSTFLRECQIEIDLEPLSTANLERVHELTQRTNQMNFSGNRYDRKLLEQIAANPSLETYVISCRDRFGSYGIVGFSLVKMDEPRMTDLMFSCRIQAKRVEHAFLTHLFKKYTRDGRFDFWADYRKTPRNAPSGQVFQDLGMEEVSDVDGLTSLLFRKDRQIHEDGIIRILEKVQVSG